MKDFSDDMVIMHLIKSYCKPILCACEFFNTSCSVVARYRGYVGHGDVFIGKCLRSAQMKLLILFKLVLGCML